MIQRLLLLIVLLTLSTPAFSSNMAVVAPNPKFQLMDSNGDPYVGGKLYTYKTGTDIPKTTWTDSTKRTANLYPIVLDSKGQADVWIDSSDGAYRFKFVDADGNVLWTKDNVYGLNRLIPPSDGISLSETYDNDLSAAITAIGSTSTKLICDDVFTISDGETKILSENIVWDQRPGCLAQGTAGGGTETLIINGPIVDNNISWVGDNITLTGSPKEKVNVRWFGATGNGTTDDSTSIRKATAFFQAIGGGRLYFPSGTYRIFSDGSTADLGDFSNLTGITIDAENAEFVVDRIFTGIQQVILFQFTACNNINLPSTIASCTQEQPVSERTSRGPKMYNFLQGCKGITAGITNLTNFRTGYDFSRLPSDPISYVCSGINLGVINALKTGYPLLGSLSGDNLQTQLITESCGRSYFFTGAHDHKINIKSKNHEASVDVLLATDSGYGMSDVDLTYTDIESTTTDNSINAVRVEFQDSELYPGTHRNINVKLDIQSTGTYYQGFGFAVSKMTSSDVPDTVDRGHTLENITVSGRISSVASGQRSLGICSYGTWGTGEYVRNINVKDLIITGCSLGPAINLVSLKTTALIENVYSNARMGIVGNAAGKIICRNVVCPYALTDSTSDTSIVDYYGCTIVDTTDQSLINKSFFNTLYDTKKMTSYPGHIWRSQYLTGSGGAASLTPAGESVDVCGKIDIYTDDGYYGTFALTGTHHATVEASDPSSKFSVTKDNSGTYNVYWSSGNSRYEIQNSTSSAGTLEYVISNFN